LHGASGFAKLKPMSKPPRIILSLGLFRSASTWAFNVTADIARTLGPVQTLFADSVASLAEQLAADTRCAVVKSHVPGRDLRLLAQFAGAATVLTVRDPLDCVASLMEQFKEDFAPACADVAASARASLAVLDVLPALVVRYEAPGAREAQAVSVIAEHLAASLSLEDAAQIAQSYRPETVRSTVDALMLGGGFDDRPAREQFDPRTHWHPGHVGSGATGRHVQVLSASERAIVAYATREFRQRLGYAGEPTPGLASDVELSFAGEGLAHCISGVCDPEACARLPATITAVSTIIALDSRFRTFSRWAWKDWTSLKCDANVLCSTSRACSGRVTAVPLRRRSSGCRPSNRSR
jgi:hypothetical protein